MTPDETNEAGNALVIIILSAVAGPIISTYAILSVLKAWDWITDRFIR